MNKTFVCLLVVGLTLAGCSGGGDSSSAPPVAQSPAPPPPSTNSPDSTTDSGPVSARLTWSAPTHTEIGSTLGPIAGYRIYFGSEPNLYDRVIDIRDAAAMSHSFRGLAPGTWSFVITAYDNEGNESRPSVRVTKQVQ